MDYGSILKNFKISSDDLFNGAENYLSCAVMAAVMLENEPSFIFEKRAENSRQGGEISFPGGVIDINKDKSPIEAAFRETREETGISSDLFTATFKLDTIISCSGLLIHPFAGFINENFRFSSLKKDDYEVSEIFTLPVRFFIDTDPEVYHVRISISPFQEDSNGNISELLPAEKLGLPARYFKPWGNMIQKVYLYRTEYGHIWGITAAIIQDFIKRIK